MSGLGLAAAARSFETIIRTPVSFPGGPVTVFARQNDLKFYIWAVAALLCGVSTSERTAILLL